MLRTTVRFFLTFTTRGRPAGASLADWAALAMRAGALSRSTSACSAVQRASARRFWRWSSLICYGIGTGEFKPVDVDQVTDLILYAYQGVRMWSRVLHMEASVADHVIETVRELLMGTDMSVGEA